MSVRRAPFADHTTASRQQPDVHAAGAFDCDNGLVDYGFTGDLTYHGPDMTTPGRASRSWPTKTTRSAPLGIRPPRPHVLTGETIPYAGQITSATDFDGTGVTRVDVDVEQVSEGD